MKELSELTAPGAFFADMFPILAKLPTWMQTWRTRAYEYHRNQANLWLGLWKELQQDIAEGKAPECFVKQVSQTDLEKQGITEIQGAWIAGSESHIPFRPFHLKWLLAFILVLKRLLLSRKSETDNILESSD